MGCASSVAHDPIKETLLVSPPVVLNPFEGRSAPSAHEDSFVSVGKSDILAWTRSTQEQSQSYQFKDCGSTGTLLTMGHIVRPQGTQDDGVTLGNVIDYRPFSTVNGLMFSIRRMIDPETQNLDPRSVGVYQGERMVLKVSYGKGYGGVKYTVTIFDDEHEERDGKNGHTFTIKPWDLRYNKTKGYSLLWKDIDTGVPFARALRDDETEKHNFKGLDQSKDIVYRIKPGVCPFLVVATLAGIESLPKISVESVK